MTLRESQALNKIDEKQVRVQVCELDEPLCKDESMDTESPFCFVYDTVFVKLGLRLSLDLFEK